MPPISVNGGGGGEPDGGGGGGGGSLCVCNTNPGFTPPSSPVAFFSTPSSFPFPFFAPFPTSSFPASPSFLAFFVSLAFFPSALASPSAFAVQFSHPCTKLTMMCVSCLVCCGHTTSDLVCGARTLGRAQGAGSILRCAARCGDVTTR